MIMGRIMYGETTDTKGVTHPSTTIVAGRSGGARLRKLPALPKLICLAYRQTISFSSATSRSRARLRK